MNDRIAPSRIESIDVLRGITIALMLLVNDPGDPEHTFAILKHSEWNGCTLADFVFPFFLFLVGITTSLSNRTTTPPEIGTSGRRFRSIARRAGIILMLGLLLNAYPFFEKNAIAGPEWLPTAIGHILARLEMLRVTGVLQRIAIAYFLGAIIAWKATTRQLAAIVALVLVGYWVLMTLVVVPSEGVAGAALLDQPARTLAAWVDRTLLDWTPWNLGWHMWDRAIPYDPEGILSTLPAVGTVLIGVIAGRFMQSEAPLLKRVRALAIGGAAGITLGLLWSAVFPINKPLWTSSYVLYTAGAAALVLAIVTWAVDLKGWQRWSSPFLVFGTNAILVYVGGELLASILRSSIKFKIDGHRLSSGMTMVRGLEATGVDSRVASLVWALFFVGLCYVMVRPLYRRRIFLKV